MNNKQAAVLSAILCILSVAGYAYANDIVWDDIGRGSINVRTVLVDFQNPRNIYSGSADGLAKSEDAGASWRKLLSINGQKRGVNFLLFDPTDKNSLYAATDNGLFLSINQGKDWKRIFKGKDYLENECSALAILSDRIYLGTLGGLFVTRDRGDTWHKETGELSDVAILAMAYSFKEPSSIYIAASNGVFRWQDNGQYWERIFVVSPPENADGEEGEDEEQDEMVSDYGLRHIAIDPNNAHCIYLATAGGIYQSRNAGKTWDIFSDYGLLSKDVRFLLVSKKSLIYAATDAGIFSYGTGGRWQELSLRLLAGKIRSLALDNHNNLYAAAERGLFRRSLCYAGKREEYDTLYLYCHDEPDIKDVQQAAIKYAEVNPQKIALWRKQAARRAFLPKISLDIDCDRNKTIYNSIWGSYTNGGTYFVGPDDVTRYNNNNWGVSLTWDLGDLIFNEIQTSIDVRSKLMVQLRGDILDEVTKIYFERLRVKMELDGLSIEERNKRTQKELRLMELKAMLDALTGGYFSRALSLKMHPAE